MNNELKDILKASDRYQGFTFFDKPVCFKDMFKDKDFDAVQLHSTQIIDIGNGIKNIVGFCGAFKWHNNEITSLDGDDYRIVSMCWDLKSLIMKKMVCSLKE